IDRDHFGVPVPHSGCLGGRRGWQAGGERQHQQRRHFRYACHEFVPSVVDAAFSGLYGARQGNVMRPTKSRTWFTRCAKTTARAAGRPRTFLLAVAVVLVWAMTGPLFHFSDTWQLVINTGTTVVTFLMVFLIQATQNRDSEATQVKLDEII